MNDCLNQVKHSNILEILEKNVKKIKKLIM